MAERFALAASKGCDGVEADNIDAYDNSGGGWGITPADNYAYNLWVAAAAHANGLAVVYKNGNGLLVDNNGNPTGYSSALVAAFDASLNEQCHDYDECDSYAAFAAAGKSLFNAEYNSEVEPSYCGSVIESVTMKTLQYATTDLAYKNIISVC